MKTTGIVHLRDKLADDVGRACNRFFREHGLEQNNFAAVMRDQAKGGQRQKQNKKKESEIETLAEEIERGSKPEEL